VTVDERKPVPLFSIKEAAERGVDRVRQPNWVNPMDHIKLDLIPGKGIGPWLHLYSPQNKATNGRDPVDMLAIPPIDLDSKCLYAYAGPLPDSDEYKAEATEFTAMCSRLNTGTGYATGT
jgi:hypothetical protein